MDEGRKILARLVYTFGQKNVYVELQRHGLCEQEARNQAAMALAREFRLPLLATNGVSMATEFEREILDVLTSIRHGCSLDEAGLLLQQNGKRHLRSAEQMGALFRDVPEAIGATGELSDRLTFQMKDMGYEFPRYPVSDGETMDSFLRKRTFEGVATRYGQKASAKLRARADKQVETELALIAKLHLAGYFLIVWDIVEFCRKQRILVQGRGSAANSAVCYALGITAVDPGRHGAALRALPYGGSRRVARYRSRPAFGRRPRACHPVRLRALRPARRRHVRECHYLSWPVGPPARWASRSASMPVCRPGLRD